ncbi:MAG: single-stranded-DNA-specific exonuclease RecJ [Rickettsiaceae bacterium]|jgi:single-stranded-DNA-specific exonuclease|nr:single-stranded-DNA-specific exonuclease RecJ [Rickettsiaceae bacterium]
MQLVSTSVLGKKWHLKPVSEKRLLTIIQKHNLTEILARIISHKDICLDNINSFLEPKLKDLLPDPFHLLDMDKAVERIIKAIRGNEKICIFGDYDVDGATSSALLNNFLHDIGFYNVTVYIPDRIIEGYGLSNGPLEKIKAAGASLIITVDCGAVAFAAIDRANELGLDTIIIDHHLGGEKLPSACAIVNPNRLDETTNYKYLAAVGVSFLFIIAIAKTLKKEGYFNKTPEPNLLKYLDLVALGTVCDVMPLSGLNRAFVSQGLKIMAKRQNLGLKTLSDVARLDSIPSCYHLGFVIGPRINAGGRVGQASLGSLLLSCNDPIRAQEYALLLDEYNTQRKFIEMQVHEEALAIAEQYKNDPVIIVAREGWHPGVIGIVAGKLKELYQKPTAVIAINDGIGKASCRSIKGIDFGSKIVEAKFNNLVIEGGGHAMAAGFAVNSTQIEALRQFLCQAVKKDLEQLGDRVSHEYDAELNINSLTLELAIELEKLEPFGNGNPEPLFRIDDLFVLEAKVISNTHISCLLGRQKGTYGSGAIRAIAFNATSTEIGKYLMSAKPHNLSVIGSIKVNRFNNRETVNLTISDILIEG